MNGPRNGSGPGANPPGRDPGQLPDPHGTTSLRPLSIAPQRSWEIELAEHYARALHSGHLTILRFTTGWKAAFGTVDPEQDRGYLWSLRTACSPEEACRDLLLRERLLTWSAA